MSEAGSLFVTMRVETEGLQRQLSRAACQFHNLAVCFLQLPEFDPDHPHRQELRQALREIGQELGNQREVFG